ncbi:MAG: dihydroneopterin aldolase [Fimbriimonas ginsengisoli]|uniref:7,8-dihydroneopterin aldolase n=1 Tax=Fimbriimonas ginsengisoli TaxID=1005039 RepID=A0A931LSD7_FIMGI|nr:dihydroneopterin aldolase [Fimbriimonas ginsengisoli]
MRVFVEGLELHAYHGVSDAEQAVGHRYRIDLSLEVSSETATSTDEIVQTVDYGLAATLAYEVASKSQVRTVERLAGAIAQGLLDGFPEIAEAKVRVAKLAPPMAVVVQSAGVELVRRRSGVERPK